MTIQLKNRSARIVAISFDHTDWGILPRKILPRFLQATQQAEWELDEQQAAEIKELISQHLWSKLLDYLAYRERSCAECRHWLQRQHCHPALAEELINRAQSLNYLNDERFGELYIESLLGKQKSPREIRMKLFERGLDASMVQQLITSCIRQNNVRENMEELIRKHMHKYYSLSSNKRKEKVLNFMVRKGYSFDEVSRIFNALEAEGKQTD